MRKRIALAGFAALLLAGCGGKEDGATGTEAAVSATDAAPAESYDPATSGSAPASAADLPTADTDPNAPEIGSKIPEPAAPPPETKTGANQTPPPPVIIDGYRELAWEELMPEGEEERLAAMYQDQMMMLYSGGAVAEGSAADVATQIGTFNAVKELDGVPIRLPGYTVPFEYGADAKITEFLLVPYFGACIHAPPPPPNQTILVRTSAPVAISDLAQAVWVRGTLKVEIAETDLADAAYVIVLDDLTAYEY